MQQKQKRPNNEEPTAADLFLLTHTHRNGKPMKKEKADIIVRHKEVIYTNNFLVEI